MASSVHWGGAANLLLVPAEGCEVCTGIVQPEDPKIVEDVALCDAFAVLHLAIAAVEQDALGARLELKGAPRSRSRDMDVEPVDTAPRHPVQVTEPEIV